MGWSGAGRSRHGATPQTYRHRTPACASIDSEHGPSLKFTG